MLLITLKLVHVAVCIFLILVVLLQQGKGADLSVFGGGATQSAFGARGAANVFHKLTVTGFLLFAGTTMSISIVQTRTQSSTVMEDAAIEQPAEGTEAPATEAAPAEKIPAETPAAEAPAAEAEGGAEEGSGEG